MQSDHCSMRTPENFKKSNAAMSSSKLTVFISVFTPCVSRRSTSFLGSPLRRPHVTSNGLRRAQIRWVSMTTMEEAPKARKAGIVGADLKEEMSRSYMEYAMSVILGRAMPDVRDGLKPVHRRILYAMHDLGMSPTARFRKSARVVGEVLGKYHPHGETAVYDALVRMSQDFSMAAPLVDGHGNFGSTDGDPPAAMRYTECRLSALTRDGFFEDIAKKTVETGSNFDGSETEPLVLPARFPNLLLNGSSGIAVGMATNIPPHNLGELTRALLALIADPELPDAKLLRLVPAPDFPTGAQILGREGAAEMYLHGRGQIVVRARAHQETVSADGKRANRQAIVVTELPYQVNKATLVEKIAELVNTKKLDGIADLRDESDRSGTRIVIELKRDAKAEIVLNNLYKKTPLQSRFSGNVMALDNGRFPIRLTLRQCLQKFLDFRRETVRRRAGFDLAHAEAREHLVDGFLTVQQNCDAVVRDIRASKDATGAKATLMKSYGLSELQADSVLSMQLRRLTSLEQNRLEREKETLVANISEHKAVLADIEKVDAIIAKELKTLSKQYAVERRSVILEDVSDSSLDIDEKSLILNERSVIVVTEQGYIKRMAVSAFDQQQRGTRGKRGVGRLRENDVLAHFFTCMAHDKLLVVSKNGKAYDLPAYKVPVGSPSARGSPVFQLLPEIEAGQTVASVLPVTDCQPGECLVLLTQEGLSIRTELSQFKVNNSKGKQIIRLDEGDELRWVRRCEADDSILIASEHGMIVRMHNSHVRGTARGARGVIAMSLYEGDAIAGMDIIRAQTEDRAYALVVTSLGDGKRMPVNRFEQHGRPRKGREGLRFRQNAEDRVVSLHVCCEDDSVMLATRDGTIVRQRISRILSKTIHRSRGCLLQRLDAGDEIAAVTILPSELSTSDEEDNVGTPSNS